MAEATTRGRRALFARLRGGAAQVRPPWSIDDADFTEVCKGTAACNACVQACPQTILTAGHAGYPIVDFARGACTFCGACVQACPEPCFQAEPRGKAWSLVAHVSQACVEQEGVSCRMCADACEADAIRFRPKLGGGSTVLIDRDACSGCGACLAPCPVNAISIAAPISIGAAT